MAELFERATRLQIRYGTDIGALSVEDLWTLPLSSPSGMRTNLDDIARACNKQLKSGDDVSFVNPERKSDELTQLKFDVVYHIIQVRLDEAKKAAEEKERADKKQMLLGILAEKDVQSYREMSKEDLAKAIRDL
jgi:hypothetical protein